MGDRKIYNNYDIMNAAIAFNNYLNTNDETIYTSTHKLDVYPRELYNKMIVTHCALSVSLFKEKIVIEDNNNKILNIADEVFDMYYGSFIITYNNKSYIDGKEFDNRALAFEFLRHKLMHGDYYIEDDYIYLKDEDSSYRVLISNLLLSCSMMSSICNFYKTGSNKRNVTLFKRNKTNNIDQVNTIKDLRTVFDDIYLFTVNDSPANGRERNLEYASVLESFIKDCKLGIECANNNYMYKKIHPSVIIGEVFKKYNNEFRRVGANVGYQIKKSKDCSFYSKCEKTFLSNIDQLNNIFLLSKKDEKIKFLNDRFAEYSCFDDDSDFALQVAIGNNLMFLDYYVNKRSLDNLLLLKNYSFTYIDDMTIVALFNAFYSLFHYGLDTIISKNGSTSLKNVINDDVFRFDKLQISDLYDDNMTYDVSFKDLPNQLIRMKNSIPKLRDKYDELNEKYKKFLESKVDKPEIKKQYENNLKAIIDEINEAIKCIPIGDEFINNDFDLFVKNYNTIAHIRNAFAHGNVKFLPYVEGDTLLDRTIIIEDIHKGKVTYSLKLSYIEFYDALNNLGLVQLVKFISNKTEEELLNEHILVKLKIKNELEDKNVFRKLFNKIKKKF